jgi:hypothetical protein
MYKRNYIIGDSMQTSLEKKINKNELINFLVLKLEENKIYLNSKGIMFNVELEGIRIMNNELSITTGNIVIRVNKPRKEITLHDLEKNEIFVYNYSENEIKVKITRNLVYFETEITEITPISQEALMKTLEALNIPFGSRFLSRFDINLENYVEFEYNTEEGLKLRYGLSEIEIKRDKITVDNVTINLGEKGYFIFFEKGIMSILF